MTRTVRLGEIVDFYSGGTPNKARAELWQGAVPWFSAKDIKSPRLIDSFDHVSESVFKQTSLRRLPAGTVVLVVRGMILAHTVPVSIIDVPATVNQDLKALLPKREIDTTYLAAMLRAQHGDLLSKVSTAAHGTKKLETRVLAEVPIPLPSIEEQQRIVAILDHAGALRTKRRQVLGHLDALAASIFDATFGSSAARGSAVGSLGDVLVDGLSNGLSPSAAGEIVAEVLTLSAVTGGKYDPSVAKAARFAKSPTPKQIVRPDSFLISRGNGNRDLVGVGVVAQPAPGRPFIFPDTVIGGQIDRSRIEARYLEAVFATDAVRQQVRASARTTNGTYKVNQQGLGAVTFPLPPLDLQRQFAERVDAIAAQRTLVERVLAADDELFASLQSRAFRGEL